MCLYDRMQKTNFYTVRRFAGCNDFLAGSDNNIDKKSDCVM